MVPQSCILLSVCVCVWMGHLWNQVTGRAASICPSHFLNPVPTLALVSRTLHLFILTLHWLRGLWRPQSQHTLQSLITWLEDEDFFLSVLGSVLLSALHSFLSPVKEEPSKLDFDLGK